MRGRAPALQGRRGRRWPACCMRETSRFGLADLHQPVSQLLESWVALACGARSARRPPRSVRCARGMMSGIARWEGVRVLTEGWTGMDRSRSFSGGRLRARVGDGRYTMDQERGGKREGGSRGHGDESEIKRATTAEQWASYRRGIPEQRGLV